MRRIQFFEIHEQSWFPSFLRDDVTDALQHGMVFLRAYAPVVPLVQRAMGSEISQSILDLCSGGGGPWPHLSRNLNGNTRTNQVCLSDKFPNLRAFQNVSGKSENHITYFDEPVDAMKVPRRLRGFRTMFSSYHHFPPDEARAVLQDAVDAGESIGIFEVTRRAPLAIGLMFPWAFLVFVTTPWIRPFRWSRLFWTYLIPIVPIVVLFDGVVSCLRTYRPEELRKITEKITGTAYHWQAGEHAKSGTKLPITYLIGQPREGARASRTRIARASGEWNKGSGDRL